jgi:hypothetical protein
LEFVATNTPDPPYWTQTHVFWSFKPFHYCTNFNAKQAALVRLMYWLVQRSHVGICHNDRTRSTQSNSCFGAFRTSQVRATKLPQNFSQRTHLIYPIGPQTVVLGRFGLFYYCTNFGAKCAELVQLTHKFVQRSRVEISRNKCTPSTLLDSNSSFVVFQTISLLHKLHRKTGRTGAINALVHAMKTCRNFSQNELIHPIGLKLMFWGVSDRFIIAQTLVQNRLNWCD